MRHVISELLTRQQVHDDVLTAHSVSVTEVRMSPDLRHATVYVKSLLGSDEDEVLKALRTNTAYFQREVAGKLKLKYAAKIKFLPDESFDEAGRIDATFGSASRAIWERMMADFVFCTAAGRELGVG